MSSLTRMLSVLDLFSREHTTLTAEQVATTMGLTRTTCYRYVRELCHAGLLVSDGGLFMLGPRIIELDHRIIESDPLLHAGQPVVDALADSLGATGLLTTSYDDHIINIYQHEGARPPLPVSFGRGTSMPLFRSSTSKVILAAMSRSRLKRLWARHQHESDCQAVGTDWLAFWRALQAIKRQGYWTSVGELDADLAGIATPIIYGTGEVAGSLSLVFAMSTFQSYDTELLGMRLCNEAAKLSLALAELGTQPEPAAQASKTAPAKKGTPRSPAAKATDATSAAKAAQANPARPTVKAASTLPAPKPQKAAAAPRATRKRA